MELQKQKISNGADVNKISFSPERVGKSLLSVLSARMRDIIERRFGLGKVDKKETLESIGKDYDITRERVRQIENYSLGVVRQSPTFKKIEPIFQELKTAIVSYGGLVEENNFLNNLVKSQKDKNYVYFFLMLGDDFKRMKEDEEFKHRWTTDEKSAERIHDCLRNLHKETGADETFSQEEMNLKLAKQTEKIFNEKFEPRVFSSWYHLSHLLAQNPLGQWGLASSPQIRPRGVRDLAYLVMEKHGSPMHFREVAGAIERDLGRHAYVQTVHNELIKDERFVLVGRGLYALKQWGYKEGKVSDIMKNILVSSGPLNKDELIKRVLKERHIKESTIIINLQNKKYFQRLPDGKYAVKSKVA